MIDCFDGMPVTWTIGTSPDADLVNTMLDQAIAVLPPDIVIHRLTGDGAKRDLIAPLWSADKKRVLSAIQKRFEQDGVMQGSALRG